MDDFLADLHWGVREVVVPKELVTEPLGRDWVVSKINLPSPDTIAGYRKGQYHAHLTKSSYNVHLDRVDPAKKPFMHLVDDAPLVLMISSVFSTTIADAKTARHEDKMERLKAQSKAWKTMLGIGLALITLGILLFLRPLEGFGLVILLIPLAVIGFGLFTMYEGLHHKGGKDGKIWQGLVSVVIGFFMFLLVNLILMLILLFLAAWLLMSSYVSLKRGLERKNVPEGSWIPIAIGLLSLVLAILVLVAPEAPIVILVWVAAAMAILIGLVQVNNALIMRGALKEMRRQAGMPTAP